MHGLKGNVSLNSKQLVMTIALWNLRLNGHITDNEMMMFLGMDESDRRGLELMNVAVLAAQRHIEAILQDNQKGSN